MRKICRTLTLAISMLYYLPYLWIYFQELTPIFSPFFKIEAVLLPPVTPAINITARDAKKRFLILPDILTSIHIFISNCKFSRIGCYFQLVFYYFFYDT